MIFNLISLFLFSLASYQDIKKSEFTEFVPIGIIIVNLISYIIKFQNLDLTFSLSALIFYTIGLILYKTKQWAFGDMIMLFALGFVNPHNFINNLIIFFAVSLTYSLGYAIYFKHKNNRIFDKTKDHIKFVPVFLISYIIIILVGV